MLNFNLMLGSGLLISKAFIILAMYQTQFKVSYSTLTHLDFVTAP